MQETQTLATFVANMELIIDKSIPETHGAIPPAEVTIYCGSSIYKKMTINQSGRFMDLGFQDGPHISGKLERQQYTSIYGEVACGTPEFALTCSDLKLIIAVTVPPSDTLLCNLDGKQSYRFLAQRMISKP